MSGIRCANTGPPNHPNSEVFEMAAAKSNRTISVGDRFGRLTVVRTWREDKRRKVEVVCDCGGYAVCRGDHLRSGATQSCGCMHTEANRRKRLSHGHTVNVNGKQVRSPTYESWRGMRLRCYSRSCYSFQYYGARGVKVCDRWNDSFAAFLEDMGERPEGMTLDRLDPYGNYEPSNCRWAHRSVQDRNRRSPKLADKYLEG